MVRGCRISIYLFLIALWIFMTHDMQLQNSSWASFCFFAAAYHLESLVLHINTSLPSQICGIGLCWLAETLDQSIISVLVLASSIRISYIILVNDLIVARQGAKKVVLPPEKCQFFISRLPIGAHQSVLGMLGILVRLAFWWHLHWDDSLSTLENYG